MNSEVVGGVIVHWSAYYQSLGKALCSHRTSHHPGVLGEFSPGGDRDGGLSGEISTIFKLGGLSSLLLPVSTAPPLLG